MLDLEALRRAELVTDPFAFTIVPSFLPPDAAAAVRRDFPDFTSTGLLPVAATRHGPAFAALVEELHSPKVAAAFGDKFGLDLSGHPMMVTVRGRCQERDGRIHTDSETKLLTALIYMNDGWDADGGRLRLLRSPDNLDDMIAEVPPDSGTLIAFRRSANSYHGHAPFVGVRRTIMFNWMTSSYAARREVFRHHVSAVAKRVLQYA